MMTRWKNKLKPTITSQVDRQCADESPIDTYGLPIVTYQCSVYISCQRGQIILLPMGAIHSTWRSQTLFGKVFSAQHFHWLNT
jgi:hypothetical protein